MGFLALSLVIKHSNERRLIADKSIKELNDFIERLRDKQKEMADAVENYATYAEMCKQLEDDIRKFNEKANRVVCPYVWGDVSY